MRCQEAPVKSGDEAKRGTLAALFVDYFLRIIETAAALHFASETSVGLLRRRGALARGFADLALGDAVADTHDHVGSITANATYSQVLI